MPRGEPNAEKHLHSLEAREEVEDSPNVSHPDQAYFNTIAINRVTKDNTESFLEVEVESDQWKKNPNVRSCC